MKMSFTNYADRIASKAKIEKKKRKVNEISYVSERRYCCVSAATKRKQKMANERNRDHRY